MIITIELDFQGSKWVCESEETTLEVCWIDSLLSPSGIIIVVAGESVTWLVGEFGDRVGLSLIMLCCEGDKFSVGDDELMLGLIDDRVVGCNEEELDDGWIDGVFEGDIVVGFTLSCIATMCPKISP